MTTRIAASLRAAVAGLALAFLILPAAPLGGIVPTPTVGGTASADDNVAYWGPLNEPVCNRSPLWDIGLIGFGVITTRAEVTMAKSYGWAFGAVVRGVSRAARIASGVGIVSIVVEMGLIAGDHHSTTIAERGDSSVDILAVLAVAIGAIGALWVGTRLLVALYIALMKREVRRKEGDLPPDVASVSPWPWNPPPCPPGLTLEEHVARERESCWPFVPLWALLGRYPAPPKPYGLERSG